ncbi:MAG: hypothetical protein HQK94_17980 [Nitrospirae bacterium]|nr:hypothetical protein [Nitrospirota bacterium]
MISFIHNLNEITFKPVAAVLLALFTVVSVGFTKSAADGELPPAEQSCSVTGSVRSSVFTGHYDGKQDSYGVVDNSLNVTGKQWKFELSVPVEPYLGPPASQDYRIHILEALGSLDLTPEAHFLIGIFPTFGRGSAAPVSGFNNAPTGNYDVFRSHSPIFLNGLSSHAGIGFGYDIGKALSVTGRLTYQIPNYIGAPGNASNKPTISTQLNMNVIPSANISVEYVYIAPSETSRIASSISIKQQIGALTLQIYAGDIAEHSSTTTTNAYNLATGIGGEIDPQTLWRIAAGVIKNAPIPRDGYVFFGINRRLGKEVSADITATYISSTNGGSSFSLGPSITYSF